MLKFSAFHQSLQSLKPVAVTNCHRFKLLDLNRELIDDTPGNDLLAGKPLASFQVIGLSEEELKMEQVSELTALEYLHEEAR